jgi:hypothetical protein
MSCGRAACGAPPTMCVCVFPLHHFPSLPFPFASRSAHAAFPASTTAAHAAATRSREERDRRAARSGASAAATSAARSQSGPQKAILHITFWPPAQGLLTTLRPSIAPRQPLDITRTLLRRPRLLRHCRALRRAGQRSGSGRAAAPAPGPSSAESLGGEELWQEQRPEARGAGLPGRAQEGRVPPLGPLGGGSAQPRGSTCITGVEPVVGRVTPHHMMHIVGRPRGAGLPRSGGLRGGTPGAWAACSHRV